MCAWFLQYMSPHGRILYEKCVRQFPHCVKHCTKVTVYSHTEIVHHSTWSLVSNSHCEAAALTMWPIVYSKFSYSKSRMRTLDDTNPAAQSFVTSNSCLVP